jgi:hypothetical protein
MGKKRVTEIMIETRQVTVRRHHATPLSAWCADCADTVQMLTAEQAAEISGLSVRAIYRQLEQGRFHLLESLDGQQIRLCLNSVSQSSLSGSNHLLKEKP